MGGSENRREVSGSQDFSRERTSYPIVYGDEEEEGGTRDALISNLEVTWTFGGGG